MKSMQMVSTRSSGYANLVHRLQCDASLDASSLLHGVKSETQLVATSKFVL